MSSIAPTLQLFFTERMARQLQASPRTVVSYRDTCRLLLRFVADRTGKAPSALGWQDLDAEMISAFLDHLEADRHNSARSRSTRLAALRSLFGYAALRHPEHAELIRQVLAIPQKRFDKTTVPFLNPEEVRALLGAPDLGRWEGRRDRALMALAVESAMLTEDLHRRQSEARFASLVQNSSDMVTVILADSTIRYQSPSVKRVMGYEAEELVGARLIEYLIHPDDVPRIVALLAEIRGQQDRAPELVEFRWRHRDGRWVHVESMWSDLSLDPNVGGIVLNTRDISERKLFEQQLQHQAFHDSITGLANRALFRDRVGHSLARQQRDGRSAAVLFTDIDDFKTVNDSLGHAAGDQVLRVVGDQITSSIRAGDTAARLGGDEV